MNHPGRILIEELKAKNLTQKDFSLMLGKRVSELNELIKGKRNITILRDILLSKALGTPEKYWIHKQIDYDYYLTQKELNIKTEFKEKIVDTPEIVVDLQNVSAKNMNVVSMSKQKNQETRVKEIDLDDYIDDSDNKNIKKNLSNHIDFEKRKKLQDIFMNF